MFEDDFNVKFKFNDVSVQKLTFTCTKLFYCDHCLNIDIFIKRTPLPENKCVVAVVYIVHRYVYCLIPSVI